MIKILKGREYESGVVVYEGTTKERLSMDISNLSTGTKFIEINNKGVEYKFIAEDKKWYLQEENECSAGVTPNIQIGTVTTLEPNEKATVTRKGTDENPVFDFGIPKGESGIIDTSNFYTKGQTDSKIAEEIEKVQIGGGSEIDLSSYATKTELEGKADKNHTHSEYLTSHQDISGKADKTYVDEQLTKKSDIHEHPYLSNSTVIPSKTSQLQNDSNFLTSIPEEYVTNSELESKGYLTSHQDISHKANSDEVYTKLQTEDKIAKEIAKIDLSNYYTKAQVDKEVVTKSNEILDEFKLQLEDYFTPKIGACTSITLGKSPFYITKLMEATTITAITIPKQTIEEIIWSNTFEGTQADVEPIGNSVKITPYIDCEGTITAKCGSQSVTIQVKVASGKIPSTSLNLKESGLVFNNNGEEYAQIIHTYILPPQSNEEVVWEVVEGDPSMIRIEKVDKNAKVIPLKSGECTVKCTCGIFEDKIKIKNVQHSSLLTNPQIRVENHKAILEQDGHTETFDLSFEPNVGHPQYKSCRELRDNEGVIHYLSILNSGVSKFRLDGGVPDSGGWHEIENKEGQIYAFILTPFPKINGFNFTYDIRNKNNTINKELFDFSLKTINTAFPALNISENPSSVNTMEMGDYNDTWFGENAYYSDHFDIRINAPVVQRAMGSYEQYPRRWANTTVHELGHSLGIRDYPKHKPSLYDYGANPDKNWYMQPNDLDVIKYYYKYLWNVDITLSQDEINRQIALQPYAINAIDFDDTNGVCFNFGHYTNEELVNKSDVIIEGKLGYIETKAVDIGTDAEHVYKIYKIIPNKIEKGELHIPTLKIHESINVDIDSQAEYKLYLTQYENCPCSLLNIDQAIVRIKEE